MTLVMGILNATPDSFSDGGDIDEADALRQRIQEMLDAGVDILDVGGESTRPGHTPVSADEEIRRVLPVIHTIRALANVPISIDTSKAAVADAALQAGATMVNDVSALGDPDMADVVLRHGCDIVLMRHQDLDGEIVSACREELDDMVMQARREGIPDGRIIIDPGLGFGERPGPYVDDNLALIDGIADYAQGFRVLIGASRKRFVGAMMDEPDARKRLVGSVEMAVRAARSGADIVRVHDVEETVKALSGLFG